MTRKNIAIDRLNQYISRQGLKHTHQRDIITTILFSHPHKHFRIEEILKKSRKKDPSIGYVTVYRTLMMLIDAGLAKQQHFGKGQSRFEVVSEHHHDHLICNKCGAIIEFEDKVIEKNQEAIAKKYSFKLSHHKMELYGLCQRCQP